VSLGIDVRLGKPVQAIDGDGVILGDERIRAKTVVWTAGVVPSPAENGSSVELPCHHFVIR
jgi:NADH dehydrogenase